MRLDRFTSKFQSALSDAQSLALGRDHQFIEPVHLMYALLKQSGSSVRALFAQMSISVDELNTKLSQEIEKLFKVEGVAKLFSLIVFNERTGFESMSWD